MNKLNSTMLQIMIAQKKRACSQWISKVKPFKVISSMLPILSWIPLYNFKNDLVSDLISGCTVAVMHIPQGLGYAMLGSVPAIVGIYTAFFPVLIYFIFGTSKHNSMGTFAVVAIMVGKVVAKYAIDPDSVEILGDSTINDALVEPIVPRYTPIQVTTSLCVVVACVQILMYVFRLGIVSTLLSETLVSGLTTGAAIGVVTSQIKEILGIKIKPINGNFEIILSWYEIIYKIPTCNWMAIAISAIAISILIANDEWLKPKLSKICVIPVPIQLIAVIAGTLASTFFDLPTNFKISTVGDIPTGFPAFQLPDLNLSSQLILDGFIIAMVSYTITVSLALTFAQRFNYEVDFNQELLALGTANFCGSFFSCLPVCASLSRSSVQVQAGGRTQLTSVVSCAILAIVLMWVGPLFEILPKCILASIVVVALKGMLMQIKDFFEFWRLSRLDAFVWLITCLTVIIVAIDIGLLVGVVLSLVCIFVRSMKPYTCLLGNVPNTDLYLDIKRYKAAEEIDSIKIFHYCGSLNFASRTVFKSDLCSLIEFNLGELLSKQSDDSSDPIKLKCLIIDFSALSYIDPSGVLALKLLINDFHKLSINVFIAGASSPAYEMMKRCGLNEKPDSFKFYPTIHDAVYRANDGFASIPVITESS